MNGIFTDWIEGVPQGTALSPLLLNLYINDSENRICDGCTLLQYADDCMVYASSISSNDALSQLQKYLNELTVCRRLLGVCVIYIFK